MKLSIANRMTHRSNPSIMLVATAVALLFTFSSIRSKAAGLERVRFIVTDNLSHFPVNGAEVTIEDPTGRHNPVRLPTQLFYRTDSLMTSAKPTTLVFNARKWRIEPEAQSAFESNSALSSVGMFEHAASKVTLITISAGVTTTLQAKGEPPVADIQIKITANRLTRKPPDTGGGVKVGKTDINTFGGGGGGSIQKIVEHGTPAPSDSNGQQHVRGEHAETSYIIDGVLLPDLLSGRQGSVVVPSTINSVEILTGGFAPEFGQQTAAILNITTQPRVSRSQTELNITGGTYNTTNGDISAIGPIGKYLNYSFDVAASRTLNASEPQQPDNQTAHNGGASLNYFGKLRFQTSKRDALSLSISEAPDSMQLSNRTGLPASFTQAGQGFGFLGQRNADGTRPDVSDTNRNSLGAQPFLLGSQQAVGQDINQREVSEFGTLSWQRDLSSRDSSLLAITLLHSGQDVHNHNPLADLLNLPVDNSIEYSPTVSRNVHHIQVTGSISSRRGRHSLKSGFLLDDQNGDESYQLVPGSRLALDTLAAVAPNLAPTGAPLGMVDGQGNPIFDSSGNPLFVSDVNNNPVYMPSSNSAPVLKVHRSGFYRALYLQDTWEVSRRFTINYGLRGDWLRQTQNLGQSVVDTAFISPRFNFSYLLDRHSNLQWSYNRLFNTPPLAQGAVIGQPIQPEVLDQYDISIDRQLGHGQNVKLAYYVKDIRNQVDTGLLIPGSQIGIFSGINFQFGGVHGIEFSYNISPPKGVGWDVFFNYGYTIARPNGLDNTGAPVPTFNDHDQRNTGSLGVAYLWKGGASAAMTVTHGSGLASSPVPPSDKRIPRSELDLHFSSGPRLFKGYGGIGLDVLNLFDDRSVINFQSAFSGTRFQQGRRVLVSISGKF